MSNSLDSRSNVCHTSLEQDIRVKLTARGFLNGILLIMLQNFWKVKSLKSTIGAFRATEFYIGSEGGNEVEM